MGGGLSVGFNVGEGGVKKGFWGGMIGGGGGMCTYCAPMGGSRVWRIGESERLLAALLEAVCT